MPQPGGTGGGKWSHRLKVGTTPAPGATKPSQNDCYRIPAALLEYVLRAEPSLIPPQFRTKTLSASPEATESRGGEPRPSGEDLKANPPPLQPSEQPIVGGSTPLAGGDLHVPTAAGGVPETREGETPATWRVLANGVAWEARPMRRPRLRTAEAVNAWMDWELEEDAKRMQRRGQGRETRRPNLVAESDDGRRTAACTVVTQGGDGATSTGSTVSEVRNDGRAPPEPQTILLVGASHPSGREGGGIPAFRNPPAQT